MEGREEANQKNLLVSFLQHHPLPNEAFQEYGAQGKMEQAQDLNTIQQKTTNVYPCQK